MVAPDSTCSCIKLPIFVIGFQYRGGSRTSPKKGANPWGGRLPNILVIFSEKPYEIKEILVRWGGGAPGAPPKSATTVESFLHKTIQHYPGRSTSS